MPVAPRSAVSRMVIFGLVLLVGSAWSPTAAADPPGRVARVGHWQGEVGYSPYGEADWIAVERNRPLVRGDRLWTDADGRAELQVGSAAVRLAPETSLEVLDLDDEIAQFEVTQGSVNLRVLRVQDRQTYEIATPLLAFVASRAGRYRVDVDPRRDETTIVVWEGSGEAYGQDSRFSLRAGEAVRFNGTDLRRYQVLRLPRADAFDEYCIARDRRLEQSPSLRYVDDDLIGYADLDEYGAWSVDRSYGSVWYPRGVGSGWTPYRDGRWVWQEPWGWTWVDDAPWGFAPMHYGRWARIGSRWGWIPGPRRTRAVFAPALVAFVGGSGWSLSLSSGNQSPVGWFPLGPREAYVPTYRASRDYFDRVNRHNTNIDAAVIRTLFNRYERGSGSIAQANYAHRNVPGALVAVPGSVFTEARSVRGATLRLDPRAATSGEVVRGLPLRPGDRSVRGQAQRSRSRPAEAVFERPVFARHAAPARQDAAAPSGAGPRTGASQEGRASAARDRDQRGRANVRQLQTPEAQPNARREPLADGAAPVERGPGDRGRGEATREPVAPSGREIERTAADQRQRAAQDEVQRQAGRDAQRAADSAAREREQVQGQQRLDREASAERERDQVEAQRRSERDASAAREREQAQQRTEREASAERERGQAEVRQRAEREASAERERGQAEARQRAEREASAERERGQAEAQQRGEREASAERERGQAEVRQRAEREASADRERDQAQQRAERDASAQRERGQSEALQREAARAGNRGNPQAAPPEAPQADTGKPDRDGKDRPKTDAEEDKDDTGKRKPPDGGR